MQAADRASHTLPVLGRGLHFFERGSGAPVLLVHGLGAGAHVWDRLDVPEHRLIAVDLPGCGGSEPRSGPLAPEVLAELLLAFMQRLVGEVRFAAVGHSLGSAVAAELALGAPARVSALGLIDVPGRLPLFGRLPAMPLIGETIFGLSARAPVSRGAVRRYLSLVFAEPVDEETVERYWRSASAPGYFPSVLASLRGMLSWRGIQRLRGLTPPTAVIWGEKDRFFPLSQGRRLAESMPTASFHPIPGCGHSPPEEAPAEVSRLLTALLRRAGSRSRA